MAWNDRSGRNPREYLRGCRNINAAPAKPTGERLDRASSGRRLALQTIEHVEVLALDHRPRVVTLEVGASVAPQSRMQRSVRLEGEQRLGEFLVALVVQ